MEVAMNVKLDQFEVRPVAQRTWQKLIVMALFFGSIGTGLFLVSSFYGFAFGIILALIIVVVGMGGGYLADLGHPLRVWRILASWTALKTSWITRGLWGIAIFIVFGLLSLASLLGWLPWSNEAIAARVILGIAVVAGIWVMLYTGIVLAASPSIRFWNTPMLPALFMVYGLLGGIDITFISVAALGEIHAVDVKVLELIQISLIILCLIFIWAYLAVMSSSSGGAREAVRMITKGELASIFWGVVIVAGLIIPLVVVLYTYIVGLPLVVTGVVGLLGLAGCLYFRYCVLRAGVYSPLI
ncbi:NrfD/PsrC family molybdoenzyme membrane anchor subunit [Chloroflexota bacterium]